MSFEIINNRDAIWSKFIVESTTKDMVTTDIYVQTLANKVHLMHKIMPLQWLKFDDVSPTPSTLELNLLDGRMWKVNYIRRELQGPVTFNIDPNDQWIRESELVAHIRPIMDATLNLWVMGSATHIDLRPR